MIVSTGHLRYSFRRGDVANLFPVQAVDVKRYEYNKEKEFYLYHIYIEGCSNHGCTIRELVRDKIVRMSLVDDNRGVHQYQHGQMT